VIAHDGEQAMKFLLELSFKPDLIILDLNMPYMSGLEVMSQIRELAGDKWVPIVVISGENDGETVTKAAPAPAATAAAAAAPAEPQPDPAGIATGDRSSVQDAGGTPFVVAEPTDKSAPDYADKLKDYEAFQAAAETAQVNELVDALPRVESARPAAP
jgi:CheY-like chemotaxis protein